MPNSLLRTTLAALGRLYDLTRISSIVKCPEIRLPMVRLVTSKSGTIPPMENDNVICYACFSFYFLRESEKEIFVLRETTTFQEELIKKQEIRINDQDEQINNQQLKINALVEEVAGLKVVTGNNKDDITSNNREIKGLGRQIYIANERNDKKKKKHLTENRISSFARGNSGISGNFHRRTMGGGIAFTAYLDHDGDYGDGQTIIFNSDGQIG
ncbi:uncharacterized protein LOC128546288 [Mercenaria mercenaria]|uniref:uncharacterized protein LOC128546288 n=1 Tax=Mercenaria mercenaria TaxID=6596 RepID=UPI00234EAF33|nr:uncharacterized protein LOC128546288 [Mercenaria mercenaria]